MLSAGNTKMPMIYSPSPQEAYKIEAFEFAVPQGERWGKRILQVDRARIVYPQAVIQAQS